MDHLSPTTTAYSATGISVGHTMMVTGFPSYKDTLPSSCQINYQPYFSAERNFHNSFEDSVMPGVYKPFIGNVKYDDTAEPMVDDATYIMTNALHSSNKEISLHVPSDTLMEPLLAQASESALPNLPPDETAQLLDQYSDIAITPTKALQYPNFGVFINKAIGASNCSTVLTYKDEHPNNTSVFIPKHSDLPMNSQQGNEINAQVGSILSCVRQAQLSSNMAVYQARKSLSKVTGPKCISCGKEMIDSLRSQIEVEKFQLALQTKNCSQEINYIKQKSLCFGRPNFAVNLNRCIFTVKERMRSNVRGLKKKEPLNREWIDVTRLLTFMHWPLELGEYEPKCWRDCTTAIDTANRQLRKKFCECFLRMHLPQPAV